MGISEKVFPLFFPKFQILHYIINGEMKCNKIIPKFQLKYLLHFV
jgi:hypothetical protein